MVSQAEAAAVGRKAGRGSVKRLAVTSNATTGQRNFGLWSETEEMTGHSQPTPLDRRMYSPGVIQHRDSDKLVGAL